MARMPRVYIDNAYYHLVARGNQKQVIFKEDCDFAAYLNMFRKAKTRYGFRLYAYCLMPNHIHLLIEPNIAKDISSLMHRLTRQYAEYFNSKYGLVGHVWQGRFKSKPIVKDEYLNACINYIEENPLRAGIAKEMSDYPWNSYKERCLSVYGNLIDEINA